MQRAGEIAGGVVAEAGVAEEEGGVDGEEAKTKEARTKDLINQSKILKNTRKMEKKLTTSSGRSTKLQI